MNDVNAEATGQEQKLAAAPYAEAIIFPWNMRWKCGMRGRILRKNCCRRL